MWSLETTCVAHSMRTVLLAASDPDRFLDDKDYYGNKGTLSKLVEMEANGTWHSPGSKWCTWHSPGSSRRRRRQAHLRRRLHRQHTAKESRRYAHAPASLRAQINFHLLKKKPWTTVNQHLQ